MNDRAERSRPKFRVGQVIAEVYLWKGERKERVKRYFAWRGSYRGLIEPNKPEVNPYTMYKRWYRALTSKECGR